MDIERIKLLELFGGIGAIRKAFINLKIPHEMLYHVVHKMYTQYVLTGIT